MSLLPDHAIEQMPAYLLVTNVSFNFAKSSAASIPISDRVTGKLHGHSDIENTARYAHLAQGSLHETPERITGSTAADIL